MNFWQFLDRRWPSERGWVTILLAILIGSLLKMADENPGLWDIELFKTLLTAATITGALNMVLAFHFTANKSDERKTENTAAAFEAIKATAHASEIPREVEVVNPPSNPVPTTELPEPQFGRDP